MGFAKIDTLWPSDKKQLNVRFVSPADVTAGMKDAVVGSTIQMKQVKDVVASWNNISNLKFYFLKLGDEKLPVDIIVNFNAKIDDKSEYGQKSGVKAAAGKWTINVGNRDTKPVDKFQAQILHEFGHALGLYHEYQRPQTEPKMIQISKVKVQDYCTKNKVDFKIYWSQLEPLGPAKDFKISASYDNASIMRYTIPDEIQDPVLYPKLTKNLVLSAEDIAFIKELYK